MLLFYSNFIFTVSYFFFTGDEKLNLKLNCAVWRFELPAAFDLNSNSFLKFDQFLLKFDKSRSRQITLRAYIVQTSFLCQIHLSLLFFFSLISFSLFLSIRLSNYLQIYLFLSIYLNNYSSNTLFISICVFIFSISLSCLSFQFLLVFIKIKFMHHAMSK